MSRPRVLIVGGGFGGLEAAKSLAGAACDVTLVDRRNHHLFQPLLYQVATAGLSPAQIAAPIRHVLAKAGNTEVILGEVVSIEPEQRRVWLSDNSFLPYDYLVLAPGATHSYFGMDAWAPFAPGLKSIEDALEIRRRFLLAFERAEREPNPARRQAELTFVIVGAGPTGVETAGAMLEIAIKTIPREFRRADTTLARVILVEAQDRVLPSGFPPEASAKALAHLKSVGVEVRLNSRVTAIDADGATLQTPAGVERIAARNAIWAAGVKASPLGAMLGAPLDRAGRVLVEPDLSVKGHPEVFVVGDLASVMDSRTGQPVPGMCPGAMQMGRHAAAQIGAELAGRPNRREFSYVDKGQLATIGRSKAVAYLGGKTFGGFIAWLLWCFVHILYLIGFRNKVLVMLEWAWAYLFFERGARLITGGGASERRNA